MTSTYDMDRVKNRRMQLEGALAQDPTSYEELRTTIESVLNYTEWPLESNEAAGNLLQMVQQKPRLEIDYSDPGKATQAMQVVWQKVKEASLTYDTHKRGPIRQVKTLLGGGAKGCTEVLTACRAELPSSSLQLLGPMKADDRQNIHHKRPPAPRFFRPPPHYVRPILLPRLIPAPAPPAPPLPKRPASISRHKPPPPTLRDDEIRQPSPRPGAQNLAVYGPSRLALVSDSDSDVEQQRVSPRERRPAVPVTISSSTTSLAPIPGAGGMITWISPLPVKVNGHSCDVFEGTHSTAGKVALKRPRIGTAGYNEDVIRRFQREITTWGRLQHPHILEYLGTFQKDGHFYFVSPFIENGTLVEYIVLHPSVNRIKLLCETANAISYLHKEGVVHGDIKASNLLIGDSGQVLLCASASGLTTPADVRTSTGVKGAGTLRWQSPELLEGGFKSFKSDVYAFGMTIAEVLTGDVPFPDLRTGGAVISAVWIQGKRPPKDPPVSSAGLSYEKVWAVAEACWSTIPERRITMSEASQLIQADPTLTALQDITSPSVVNDIGSFITSISKDPVRLNGHFCDVFEGMHSTAGRVALKRPRIGGMIGDEEATVRRFEREATTWRALRHPHILKFLGIFRRNRHLYLVSPFINNGTLVEYIVSHPEINRNRLLCETADALNYLHQNGIVHGDIKGSNILIDDNIHCLLCDFGLTKMTHSRTSTAMRGVGTFRWQSPELWLGKPKSFSSDTYAFGMTIAEVLSGGPPFAHLELDMAVMFAVIDNDERPPKSPETLFGLSYKSTWEVAEACWPKDPEMRISMSTAFLRLQTRTTSPSLVDIGTTKIFRYFQS